MRRGKGLLKGRHEFQTRAIDSKKMYFSLFYICLAIVFFRKKI